MRFPHPSLKLRACAADFGRGDDMRRRRGFTLIELMVVMALTMFIMAVLSQAFGTGLDTFRGLKALGDLQDGIRTATMILRNDLSQDHFEGKRRLSDPNFWSRPDGSLNTVREGFFAIKQGAASTSEGNDTDGLSSSRAVNHVLHFSSKLKGNRRESFYYAGVPTASVLLTNSTNVGGQPFDGMFINPSSATYASQWAEIGYYLVQSGTTAAPEAAAQGLPLASLPGTQLFSLYRCQFVGVPNNANVNNQENYAANAASYGAISCQSDSNGKVYFNTPNDWAGGTRRFQPNTATAFQSVSTLVLQNVVSFQVQVLTKNIATGAVDLTFGDVTGLSFDSAGGSPGYTLQALQITIRTFDPQTRQTRQTTIVQDL